jgi:hypothetical protein
MKKATIAAAAAAIAISGAAGAHEFVCEKTINGDVVHRIAEYPATLHIKVTVTNTHPADASVAQAVRDDFLTAMGVTFIPKAPFTLEVGESVDFSFDVTVKDAAACMQLSRAQSCSTSFEDAFQVVFDTGVAQCAARLICAPADDMGGR